MVEKIIIHFDVADWKISGDIYKAILPKIGAPDWHGDSVNALTESLVWGGINSLKPPYTLIFYGLSLVPRDIKEELCWLKEDVEKTRLAHIAKKEIDVNVSVELLP